jgi:hypothetical protein
MMCTPFSREFLSVKSAFCTPPIYKKTGGDFSRSINIYRICFSFLFKELLSVVFVHLDRKGTES